MGIAKTIVAARKKKGLTQEELAELANITVRTIQRIENGDVTPRAYTIKALADALDLRYEEVTGEGQNENLANTPHPAGTYDPEEEKHFLKTLCLASFSYLVIPLLHFLLPAFLLKKPGRHTAETIAFARSIIRQQIYWIVALNLLLLLTLAYNYVIAVFFSKTYVLHYMLPFLLMYLLNALLIFKKLGQVNKWHTSNAPVL